MAGNATQKHLCPQCLWRSLQEEGQSRPMKTPVIIMMSVAVAGLLPAIAPGQDAAHGGWHYLVQPYAMFPNMQGETGIANLPPVRLDENPGDIFANLQMGAMLYAEARNERWAFSSDLLYMD